MSNTPSASPTRFIVGLMIGAAVALIALAVYMIAKDEGSPVFVALAGSALAAGAAVVAAQGKKKS